MCVWVGEWVGVCVCVWVCVGVWGVCVCGCVEGGGGGWWEIDFWLVWNKNFMGKKSTEGEFFQVGKDEQIFGWWWDSPHPS